MTTLIIIILIIAIVVVAVKVSGSTKKTPIENKSQNDSKDSYPDRNFNIDFLSKKVNELISEGNIELANLNYAKLIESIRQQNITSNGKLTELLTKTTSDYSRFREKHQAEYPEQFLPPNERKKKTKKFNEDLFIGDIYYSENKMFSVGIESGSGERSKGKVSLIKNNEIVFTISLQRPNDAVVSNNGFIAVCDWLFSDKLNGIFYLYDNFGKEIFVKKVSSNLGLCAISADSKYALFETYDSETDDSNKIFIVDINNKIIASEFQRPTAFNKAVINSENKNITLSNNSKFDYEIDFTGKQINIEKYEKTLLEKGTVYEKLIFYTSKENDSILKNNDYLNNLLLGLKDSDVLYSFGEDKLYRRIGEYYEANNNIEKTIEYWKLAVDLNPKVGIKKKLDKYLLTKP